MHRISCSPVTTSHPPSSPASKMAFSTASSLAASVRSQKCRRPPFGVPSLDAWENGTARCQLRPRHLRHRRPRHRHPAVNRTLRYGTCSRSGSARFLKPPLRSATARSCCRTSLRNCVLARVRAGMGLWARTAVWGL